MHVHMCIYQHSGLGVGANHHFSIWVDNDLYEVSTSKYLPNIDAMALHSSSSSCFSIRLIRPVKLKKPGEPHPVQLLLSLLLAQQGCA